MIYPYFIYCILAWGCACKSLLTPLLLLQKKLIRILTNSGYYAHTEPLFKELKLLKLDDLYILNSQILMYQCIIMNKYPTLRDSITNTQANHEHGTRTVDLRLPYCRTTKSKQRLLYQSIKNWNSVPYELKSITSLKAFKTECKISLLNNY